MARKLLSSTFERRRRSALGELGDVLKQRDIERRLRRLGCHEARSRGTHNIWDCGRCRVSVPYKKKGDLPVGTVRNIERSLAPCFGAYALTRPTTDPPPPGASGAGWKRGLDGLAGVGLALALVTSLSR